MEEEHISEKTIEHEELWIKYAQQLEERIQALDERLDEVCRVFRNEMNVYHAHIFSIQGMLQSWFNPLSIEQEERRAAEKKEREYMHENELRWKEHKQKWQHIKYSSLDEPDKS